MHRVKTFLGSLLRQYFPAIAFKRLQRQAEELADSTEPELRALSALSKPESTFLDIGANEGLYSAHLTQKVKAVHLFEPVPELGTRLARLFPQATIHAVALSDKVGKMTLRIPIIDGQKLTTRSSVQLHDQGQDEEVVEVTVALLDDLAPDGPLLAKIDVEGHELQVLTGGAAVLAEQADAVLIEAEERHCEGSSTEIVSWFSKHGFTGWVMLGETMLELDLYDPAIHQSAEDTALVAAGSPRPASYGNNFLFVIDSQQAEASEKLRLAGFTLVGPDPQESAHPDQ